VSKLDSQIERCRNEASAANQDIKEAAENSEVRDPQILAQETLLVERCINGEVAAWEEIYNKCHAPLCATIRVHLGRLGSDPHLVDEMAARVWFALVDRDGMQLTKFNVKRGSLLTFIRLLARKEISHHFRTEQRRLKNEFASLIDKNRTESVSRSESLPSMFAEFLTSLTPRERDFCYEYLQVSAEDNPMRSENSYSSANVWQLTRRIYKKFLSFIDPTV
jgi:DNA-directed RNA polymerase specialized sigma24 family protein